MIISKARQHKGRKARIGGICFDEGKMMVFVDYYPFPDGSVGKILINMDEAREFANRVGADRIKLRAKFMRWVIRRYGE